MNKFKYSKILILSLAIMVFYAGCQKSNGGVTSLYTPTSADVTSTATLQELQQGRTLYINNCNSCHGLYSPDDYSSAQWKSILNSMAPRTGMSSPEISLVTKYITRGE